MQPAFGRLSELELRPNQIVAHNTDLENAMNATLSQKWGALRGLKVVSIALGSVTLPEEDAQMIKEAQRTAILRDPTMAAATLVGAQSDAMKTAAGNSAGAMTGFLGMGMAMNAGGAMNAQNLYAMGQKPQPQPPQQGSWKCSCGSTATGKFCPNCGAKKPEAKADGEWVCTCGTKNTGKFCTGCGAKKPEEGWKCSCGAVNKGNFCSECGARRPAGEPLYRCDKCGWEPQDPKHPPKFCPECGDPFDSRDIQ